MPFYKKNKTDIPRSRKLEQLTFKNGLRHNIFFPSGSSYRGEWADDKKKGKGIYTAAYNGSHKLHYEGDFENGLFHGFGVLSYLIPKAFQDNKPIDFRMVRIYRGEFRDGKMFEGGLRLYKDGSYYLGDWKNGKRHGFGQLWSPDGTWFVGNWVRGLKDGIGICVKKNGNRYEGNFSSGKRHGKGKFYFLDYGQVLEGVWDQDVCTVSTIKNLQFRQASLWPTSYPLPKLTLISPERICKTAQDKVLRNDRPSCQFYDQLDLNDIPKKYSVTIGD